MHCLDQRPAACCALAASVPGPQSRAGGAFWRTPLQWLRMPVRRNPPRPTCRVDTAHRRSQKLSTSPSEPWEAFPSLPPSPSQPDLTSPRQLRPWPGALQGSSSQAEPLQDAGSGSSSVGELPTLPLQVLWEDKDTPTSSSWFGVAQAGLPRGVTQRTTCTPYRPRTLPLLGASWQPL